jgi:hypothetical protein
MGNSSMITMDVVAGTQEAPKKHQEKQMVEFFLLSLV